MKKVNENRWELQIEDVEKIVYNKEIIICEQKKDKKLYMPAYLLTEAGRNIFNILLPAFDKKFFDKFIEWLNKEIEISYLPIK